jgi:hypothetical protein
MELELDMLGAAIMLVKKVIHLWRPSLLINNKKSSSYRLPKYLGLKEFLS